jgi:outer membrane protein assembly factor BamD
MRYLLLLLLVSLSLSACSKPVVPAPRTADYYFAEGETFFDKGLYDDAIASWEKVRESYYSPELNIIAELKIAEAYYLSEKFPEAAAAYEDFLKQHPNHDRVPEALYLLGLSYYKQSLPPDRDQTATTSAMVTFQDLLKRFPNDRHGAEVKVLISRCRDTLAAHEVYVGRFYLRTDHFDAAINRLEGMVASYPNYFNRDEAWFYLGQAYLKKGDKAKAAKAFKTLFDDFSSSPYVPEARKLLEK